MITNTDPTLELLMINFLQKVHIEYLKPDFDSVNESIASDNPKVDIDYNKRIVTVNITLVP